MKLRAITLTEVRQFHGSVRVSGIGDGVNVLAEPNESGKSTLFDALHYLFFVKHTAQVGSKGFTLQPAAGGDPQVEAEVEVDGTLLTLRKKWGRGRTAEVWRNGVSIALRDEAEAFIAALTAPPDAGGPAGLLWVRQGVTEFDGKDDKARRSRADLMSSVTGEFEALTGGKRMDRARARAQDELDVLVSSRAARRGGPLDLAERAVTELSEAVGTLTRRAAELQGALQERRQVRRTLAELQDPDEAARRREGLARADAALAAAEQHALKVVAAASARESAALALAAVRKDIAERTRVATAVDTLTRRLTEAKSAAEDASARAGVLDAAVTTAEERLQAAVDLREAADKAVSVALTAETRREEAARRQRLTEALDAAQALAARLPALRAAAATGPDARQLDAIDAASRDLAIAEALARQSAPQLSFDARPGIVLSLNGSPLDATPRPVPEAVSLDLPGLGTLRLDPGTTDSAQRLAEARRALAAALAGSGAETAEAARTAARARADAGASLRETLESLKRLAPAGIEALKAERDPLPVEAPAPTDRAAIEANARAARAAETEARAEREAAANAARAAREAEFRAAHEHTALANRLDEARAALSALPEATTLDAALAESSASADAAGAAHGTLVADAPDLEACKASRDRAAAAVQGTEQEINAQRIRLSELTGIIGIIAGEGVEAELADTRERLATAERTKAALEREVAVLRALIGALDTAQQAARDRYFAPVLAELRPMLRLLWPGAELRFDGESLLPADLVRDGKVEPIGTLSGGTREQISLLVRLAFARLLARSGRHAPVILDDALVYTDDARMEAMFDALTLQAQDLQILVLSCRNRALRDLGGRKLRFEPVTPGV